MEHLTKIISIAVVLLVAFGSARSQSIDLGAGLVVNRMDSVPYTALAKPAKGQKVAEPDFNNGSTITRITDVVNDFKATVAQPNYPTCQAWNCDESYMILYITLSQASGQTGCALYQGVTPYSFIKFIPINPADIEQYWWDRVNPDILYYISNHEEGATYYCQLLSMDVTKEQTTVVYDFVPKLKALGWPSNGPVRCGYPFFQGNPNNEVWGMMACGIPNINGELAGNVFGFHRSTGAWTYFQGTGVSGAPAGAGIALGQPRTQALTSLPSGNGWFWNDADPNNASNDHTWVFNADGSLSSIKLNFSSNEHIGSMLNAAGEDVLVGLQFDTPVQGNIIVANLTKGTITTLAGVANGYGYPRTGSLIGGACWKNPGWCVTGMTGNPYGNGSATKTPTNTKTFLDQEIMIANVDNGKVYRVCHHRSTGYYTSAPVNNYWAQTNVVISPSGTRVLFNSDWGNANPYAPVVDPNAAVDVYVLELPSYGTTVNHSGSNRTIDNRLSLAVHSVKDLVNCTYTIPTCGNVKLEVFNAQGERTKTLTAAYMNPGVYHVRWETGNLHSGSYYMRLTEGMIETVKRIGLVTK